MGAWSAAPPCVPVPVLDDRCEAWATIYDGRGGYGPDFGAAIATAPSGNRVYVTGTTYRDTTDIVTLAYDPATGASLWTAYYDGPLGLHEVVSDVTVSPDGSRVFVTGAAGTFGYAEWYDMATVAYDAATGQQLWAATYARDQQDIGEAVTVSPDGGTVFVTGTSGASAQTSYDAVTIAYDTATGARRWVATYATAGLDDAHAIAVTPGFVYVTGPGHGASGLFDADFTTIAYSAVDGRQVWAVRYDGGVGLLDESFDLTASPDGRRLFVTGRSRTSPGEEPHYATVAYDAAAGTQQWAAQYAGPSRGSDKPVSVAVAPDGSRVYVTGRSDGVPTFDFAYATIAYDTATGGQLWIARYDAVGFTDDTAAAVVASPDGRRVYVTGSSYQFETGDIEYATVAYDVASGAQAWVGRYASAPGLDRDYAAAMALSPDSRRLFVTGTFVFPVLTSADNYSAIGTLAYDTTSSPASLFGYFRA